MTADRRGTTDSEGVRSGLRLVAPIALVIVLALTLAACGGSSSDGDGSASGIVQADDLAEPAQESDAPAASEGEQAAGVGADSASATAETTEEIAPEDAFLVFAQCLRDEGLDVDDPDFASGRGPGGFLRGFDRDDPDVQAALESCRPVIEGARPELTAEEQAERQDELVEIATCLREQGIEVGDPDFSGGGPGGGGGGFLRGTIDPEDPATQAALDTCREQLPGFGRGPGRGVNE